MEQKVYNPLSMKASEFISDEEIRATLTYAKENANNLPLQCEILEKAALGKGLTHREAAVLLASEIDDVDKMIFKLANRIKQEFYGNRIVLFAPL